MDNQEEHLGIPRLMWESDHEWKLRTLFIDANMEYYQGDRLGALSMTWANWKFMGCTYGESVQAILEECHDRCPSEVDREIERIRNIAMPKMKFVKASSNESLGTRIGPSPGGKRPALTSPVDDGVTFKKPTTDYNITNIEKELVPGFILYFPPIKESDTDLPITLLHNSAQKSQKIICFDEEFMPTTSKGLGQFRVTVYIQNVKIVEEVAASKKEGRHKAAKSALEILKKHQPIIHRDQISHDNIETIDKGKLVKQSYQKAERIKEDNIGNKMLRRMGWGGSGGIGAKQDGIAEPVFVSSADGRRGVGHNEANQSLNKRSVEDTLLSFLSNADQETIKFSTELSNKDRALVHRLCQKYNLTHKSYGKNENRYLVVGKKK